MKKIVSFLICFAILTVCIPHQRASADGMTIAIIGGAAIAVMSAAGLTFTGGDSDGSGVKGYIESKVNQYLGGRTIVEAFGDEIITSVAGKLVIPAVMYNNIRSFIGWLTAEESIDTTQSSIKQVCDNTYYGVPVWYTSQGPNTGGGKTSIDYTAYPVGYSFNGVHVEVTISPGSGNREHVTMVLMKDTVQIMGVSWDWDAGNYPIAYWSLITRTKGSNSFKLVGGEFASKTGKYFDRYSQDISLPAGGQISAKVSSYTVPESADVGYQWEGTIDGMSPDTSLEQLLREIFEDSAIDLLDIEGEIVDPGPAPTPVPTYPPVDPDIPLQDVPWGGLDDVIGSSTGEIVDSISEGVESITEAQEATTEAVESLTETITGALDVPESEELPDFKFDLRELFPFCIPFDIYRLLSSFDATPDAPHVQIPIVIDSINFRYVIDLDFSVWNPVAQAMRTAELIVYAIALAWATGKVIKW